MVIILLIIKKILWFIATILLIFSSLYFIIKLRFINFNLKKLKKSILKKESSNKVSVLFLSIGGRIGVGSIAGVALSIYFGGPGTIFWLFVFSLLTSILSFIEVVMSSKYKIKINGSYYGGPSYYLRYGLNNKKLSIIYALLLFLCYIFGFIGIQANTINICLSHYVFIPKYLVATILIIITSIIIFGGDKRIMNVSKYIVPFMTIIYIISCLIIIWLYRYNFIDIIKLIMDSAFSVKPFFSSFIPMLIIGAQRGIFATESGIGTTATSSGASSSLDVVEQGYIQIIGVYLSIIICLLTAFVILIVNSSTNIDVNGISLVNHIFHSSLGKLGDIIFLISVILFSFSTILTGYYYGESSFIFLNNNNKSYMLLIKLLTCISVYFGVMVNESFIWVLADIMVAILTIINIYGLFSLRKNIFEQIYYDK